MPFPPCAFLSEREFQLFLVPGRALDSLAQRLDFRLEYLNGGPPVADIDAHFSQLSIGGRLHVLGVLPRRTRNAALAVCRVLSIALGIGHFREIVSLQKGRKTRESTIPVPSRKIALRLCRETPI